MIIKRSPRVVWRKETKGGMAQGLLLMNYGNRGIHFLEGISATIWETCHGRSFEDLIHAVDGQGHEDEIRRFLDSLKERGLVEYE